MILITAISIGIFGIFFFLVTTKGAVKQAVENIIDSGVGHIQIHRQGYIKEPDMEKFINAPDELIEKLNFQNIEIVSKRINLSGVLYSSTETFPVSIIGGELEKEKKLTRFEDYLIKGKYPSSEKEILIGNELAESLKVDVEDKIVFTTSDLRGDLSSFAFRVSGVFRSSAKDINKTVSLISIETASKIADYNNMANEIVIRLKNDKFTQRVIEDIKKILDSELEVLYWGDVFPFLKYQFDVFNQSMFIFRFILIFAVTFSIMNVFFVSIFERIREFGVFRAMGFKPYALVKLIFLERILLALVSIILSSVICSIFYFYLSIKGLNLSIFSKSLEIWGVSSIIYPHTSLSDILNIISLVFLIVAFSIIFPARKVLKIIITDALRYV
ncbi:MAG: ABC transporter permease [Candidatus Aminicenantia bacterium]